ncbi:ferrous iron transport protein A [Membranicola marinus]|uniref:Ferrous iron transport protein A n=1 Tax=Membranihabitans marinus TaxID=1227546 RepID=A0A953HXA0_9BACT|nr:FeoA family protein [Membranihabitans marinus]MBY5959905.1 ferrous iron transport protein A [Membranihabitans marinus]
MSLTTLNHIACHKPVTIKRIENASCSARLTELGFLPGTTTTVIRKSPFGSTLYVKLNTSHIALRKKEAAQVIIQEN